MHANEQSIVEWMLEYQQARRMPAPQKFQLLTLKHVETFIDMMTDAKILFYVLEREMFVVDVRFKIFHHVM